MVDRTGAVSDDVVAPSLSLFVLAFDGAGEGLVETPVEDLVWVAGIWLKGAAVIHDGE